MTGLGRFARGKPSGGSASAPPSSNDSTMVDADSRDPSRDVTDEPSWMSLTDVNDTTDPSDDSDLSFLADFGVETPKYPSDPYEDNASSMSAPRRPTSHTTPSGGGLRMFHNKGLATPSQNKSTASSGFQMDDPAPSNAVELQVTGPSDMEGSSHTLNVIPQVGAARKVHGMVDMAPHPSSAETALRVNGHHERQDDPTAPLNQWRDLAVNEYDNSVFVTANESTRIIPDPPAAGKRPRAGTMDESSTTPGHARPGSSTQQYAGSNMVPPVARRTETPMGFSRSRIDGMPANQSSVGGPPGGPPTGYPPYTSAGFQTPGGIHDRPSGNRSVSTPSLPFDQTSVVVTPQHETTGLTQANYTLESPSPRVVPGMDFTPTHTSGKGSLTNAVTPHQPNGGDGIATPMDVQQKQGLQEMMTNEDDDVAMSFEELHEKFRSRLQDLDDNQGANGITLLKLQDMFATAYSESLQDQAGLFDLLSSLEKACSLGDAIISKYEVMA